MAELLLEGVNEDLVLNPGNPRARRGSRRDFVVLEGFARFATLPWSTRPSQFSEKPRRFSPSCADISINLDIDIYTTAP
jgi:hypothetical protein